MAIEENVPPDELPPLYDAIDPELLESLPKSGTVEFPYQGYTVIVTGDGTVTVQDTADDDSSFAV